ncbi:MAG: alanine/ornithine racemase family PLP-dependent enzyme [Clostridiales bacterium]|nr:alanine/ornithine racemase family PLP-dependent enzyme [Clostridiales bacterium]
MYPKLEINLNGIIKNAKAMKKICEENNVKLSLVTKCLVSDKRIVEELVNNGIEIICESRIQNFIDYKDIDVEKWLIREPMLSEIADVVKYSDVSLNSELKTILELNFEAKKQNKIHKIILMYELGDLREGADSKEIEELVEASLKLENIELYGIGSNLSCYGSIMPSKENMKELSDLAITLEEKFNIKFEVVTGGNSTSFEMLKNGELPNNINNLRIGEAVFLGNIPCIEKPIKEFSRNNFTLKGQIVELKQKPSIPRGTSGLYNSFGEAPVFIDKGIRKRALIAIGKQDITTKGLIPLDNKIEILDR